MSGKIKSYRELLIWQKGIDIVKDIYKITRIFPKEETYALCDQLRRSAVSIPSNIAEGQARQHTGEFRQFLFVALGSLAELDTQLVIANTLGYLRVGELDRLNGQIEELRKMIRGLISKLPTAHSPLITNRGFTLIELLIAMIVASIVGMAGYIIFSSSSWSAKVQENISEAQQNVRVAMERLAKDIRGAGFGLPSPPFSISFDNIPAGLPNPVISPVTVSNSSTAPDSITILGIGYEAGKLQAQAGVNCNKSGNNLICLSVPFSESIDKFFNGIGAFISNRRHISLGGAKYIELAAAGHVQAAGQLRLGLPAALDRDYADGTPVYIIQAVNYSIDTDTALGCSSVNPCLINRDYTMLRGGGAPAERVIFAENIEDIQISYGMDANQRDGKIDDKNGDNVYEDTDFIFSETTANDTITDPSGIIAARVNIVAKTRNPDPKGVKGFRRQCLEDRSTDAGCTDALSDGFRRRSLTKMVKLRNPG